MWGISSRSSCTSNSPKKFRNIKPHEGQLTIWKSLCYSSHCLRLLPKMHLMYNTAPDGTRIYTLKKVLDGTVTKSAHPARFSPDDKYSRHRVTLKKRYGLLLTQQKDEKNA